MMASGSKSLMIRKPHIEIKSILESFESPKTSPISPKFVLFGKEVGVGKSGILASLFTELVKNDWIIFYFQRVKEMLIDHGELYNDSSSDTYDLPEKSVRQLRIIAETNKKHFDSIKIDKDLSWRDQPTYLNKGLTLNEIAMKGIEHPLSAQFCLETLVEKCIDISEKMQHKKNGCIISSVDPFSNWDTEKRCKSIFTQLENKGFSLLDPFIPIEVANCTDSEMKALYKYYVDQRWITTPVALTDFGFEQLKTLTCNNLREFFHYSRFI
ncbi:MAG: 28S ribosomal protein S29, mitochondrial [Paramarteilia canceri]